MSSSFWGYTKCEWKEKAGALGNRRNHVAETSLVDFWWRRDSPSPSSSQDLLVDVLTQTPPGKQRVQVEREGRWEAANLVSWSAVASVAEVSLMGYWRRRRPTIAPRPSLRDLPINVLFHLTIQREWVRGGRSWESGKLEAGKLQRLWQR